MGSCNQDYQIRLQQPIYCTTHIQNFTKNQQGTFLNIQDTDFTLKASQAECIDFFLQKSL